MARPSYAPEPAARKQVEAMAAYGIPEADIAAVLKVDAKTLRKHFREELDLGHTKANAQVAGFLFNAAKNGNVTAQIFWLKTRAQWREPPAEHRHGGVIGHRDLTSLSDSDLMRIIDDELAAAGRSVPPRVIELVPVSPREPAVE
jgi:hypothetical protein